MKMKPIHSGRCVLSISYYDNSEDGDDGHDAKYSFINNSTSDKLIRFRFTTTIFIAQRSTIEQITTPYKTTSDNNFKTNNY